MAKTENLSLDRIAVSQCLMELNEKVGKISEPAFFGRLEWKGLSWW